MILNNRHVRVRGDSDYYLILWSTLDDLYGFSRDDTQEVVTAKCLVHLRTIWFHFGPFRRKIFKKYGRPLARFVKNTCTDLFRTILLVFIDLTFFRYYDLIPVSPRLCFFVWFLTTSLLAHFQPLLDLVAATTVSGLAKKRVPWQ